MVFTCECCICDCEDTERVQFKLSDEEWTNAVYCAECMEYIRSNGWSLAKDNLLGVDCLAAFRGIQDHGLPTTLVERDVLGDKSFTPIRSLRYGNEERSAALDVDLEAQQIKDLIDDLRGLDRKDVSAEDIKNIAKKYWH